jgi:ferredoxin
MAYQVTAECINCDACEPECPNEAISSGSDFCEIDPHRCTQCVGHYDQPQCVAVCPIDCIVLHPDYLETRDDLERKYARLKAEGRWG